jgi:hypothetical protein
VLNEAQRQLFVRPDSIAQGDANIDVDVDIDFSNVNDVDPTHGLSPTRFLCSTDSSCDVPETRRLGQPTRLKVTGDRSGLISSPYFPRVLLDDALHERTPSSSHSRPIS